MSLVDFLWAIPVFGLLIFIHELGHFAVAKWFDIRVHEFALGFGPVVAGFQKGETRYNLRLVPLGGFVRMAGMEDGDVEDPRGFAKKSLHARALVIAAGPIMNFVLASLMYTSFLYVVGTDQSQVPVLGEVPTACQSTLNGQAASVPCPASGAGLRKGDRVVSINGAAVNDWSDILRLVSASDGKPLAFVISRAGKTSALTVNPVFSEDRWMVGIRAATQRVPLGTALVEGPKMTFNISTAWLGGLRDMVTGRVKAQLSGPVGITKAIAEQASRGLDSLMLLTAFLSINLGMFNLLPIPALDGSRLLFMVVEIARGRRLDPQRENMVHFVGFLILVGLMVVITYSEVIGH
ncbi:MAG TPA: M50 family metallopeptidase [Symbiobacteriaceae bacterium]|jgi:regulator of sigma E protease